MRFKNAVSKKKRTPVGTQIIIKIPKNWSPVCPKSAVRLEVINLVMAGKSNDNDKSFGDTKFDTGAVLIWGECCIQEMKSSSVILREAGLFQKPQKP